MAEPVTLLTDEDLDRAMCDARAGGDLLTEELLRRAAEVWWLRLHGLAS